MLRVRCAWRPRSSSPRRGTPSPRCPPSCASSPSNPLWSNFHLRQIQLWRTTTREQEREAATQQQSARSSSSSTSSNLLRASALGSSAPCSAVNVGSSSLTPSSGTSTATATATASVDALSVDERLRAVSGTSGCFSPPTLLRGLLTPRARSSAGQQPYRLCSFQLKPHTNSIYLCTPYAHFVSAAAHAVSENFEAQAHDR